MDFDLLQKQADHGLRRYYGKYPGLVRDNLAPDGAHRGRIKVQVPGILEEGTPDGGGSKPLEVYADPCFMPGFFFIPEPGAQVWVEFVAGDINTPIWTGVWYPRDTTPQTFDGAAPTETQKIIRTVSGQQIQLDDTGGDEKLVIQDGVNQNVLTMNADGLTLQRGDSRVKLTDGALELTFGGNTLKLDSSGATYNDVALVLKPLVDLLGSHQHMYVPVSGTPAPTTPDPSLQPQLASPALVTKP